MLQVLVDAPIPAARRARIVKAGTSRLDPTGFLVESRRCLSTPGHMAASLTTAVAEVAHTLRREAFARGLTGMTQRYRQYASGLEGDYVGLRGAWAQMPDVHDPASYAVGQVLGEAGSKPQAVTASCLIACATQAARTSRPTALAGWST